MLGEEATIIFWLFLLSFTSLSAISCACESNET